jgi:hypothetical protein
VTDGSPSHSTPIKIEQPNQFVPLNTNPKEFKKVQKMVRRVFFVQVPISVFMLKPLLSSFAAREFVARIMGILWLGNEVVDGMWRIVVKRE